VLISSDTVTESNTFMRPMKGSARTLYLSYGQVKQNQNTLDPCPQKCTVVVYALRANVDTIRYK